MSGESIRVQVFGRDFPVRIHGDSDRARRVAHEVDETMRRIARTSGRAATQEVAILAALNFAEQLDRSPGLPQDGLLGRLEALVAQLDSGIETAQQALHPTPDQT